MTDAPALPAYAPDVPRLKRLEPPANRPPVTVDKGIRIRVSMPRQRPGTQTKHYPRKARKRTNHDPRNVKYW